MTANPLVKAVEKDFVRYGVTNARLVTVSYSPDHFIGGYATYITRNLILTFVRDRGDEWLQISGFSNPWKLYGCRLVAALLGHIKFEDYYEDYRRPPDFSNPPGPRKAGFSEEISVLAEYMEKLEDLFSDRNAKTTLEELDNMWRRCDEAQGRPTSGANGFRKNPFVEEVENGFSKFGIANAQLVTHFFHPASPDFAEALYVTDDLILRFTRCREDDSLTIVGFSKPEEVYDFWFVAVLIGHVEFEVLCKGYDDPPDLPLHPPDPEFGLPDMISVLSKHMDRLEDLFSERNAASTDRKFRDIESGWRASLGKS